MDNTTLFSELLNTVIRVLVIPIIPVVAAYLIALIKKETARIEHQIENKELAKYENTADNAVITAVTAVNQTYVDNIKQKNGSLSSYEQKVAFEMAREKALRIIGELGGEVLKKLHSDFDAWLENQIEYYVNKSKNDPSSIRIKKVI